MDLEDYPIVWDQENLRQPAGEVNLRAGDTRPGSSLGSSADHSSAAVPTSPNKESAFAWMAARISWELRLDELRRTAELSHARRTAGESL
jgi:hypothetical protein